MQSLDRRQLLLGGAGAFLGAAALPLATASTASADTSIYQVFLQGLQGDSTARITAGSYGGGRYGVTWTTQKNGVFEVVEKWRLDYNNGVQLYSWIPSQGRVLQLQPIDPAVGIFGDVTPYESYRINVNGFGVVGVRAATERVRIQVMGTDGRFYYGDFARYGNPAPLQGFLEQFLQQLATLNQQWATYRNSVTGALSTTVFAVATATAVLIAGPTAAVILGFIGAIGIGTTATLVAVRNNLAAVETSYNNLIDTFGAIEHAFGITNPSIIPRYNVGNLQWNIAGSATQTANFPLLSLP